MIKSLLAPGLLLLALTACGGGGGGAPQPEAPRPQGEAPLPQPEAPRPKAEAPLPEPEAPRPQAEAPLPQPEAPRPQAEAPLPQPEAPRPQPEVPPQPSPRPAPSSAPILVYLNPPAGGFRLEVDPATNHSPRLVLHLKGPEGLALRGLAFFLGADAAQAAWVRSGTGSLWFVPGGVLDPGLGEPRLARARVDGGILQVGLFQREGAPVTVGTAPLLSVVLEARPDAVPGKAALWVPDDRRGVLLDDARNLLELPLGVGSLEVR